MAKFKENFLMNFSKKYLSKNIKLKINVYN